MTVANLVLAIKKRISNARLVDLTNDTGVATTIDDDVLNSACEDAIGDFERIVGLYHDDSNFSHVSTLIHGIIYYLESYKNRESSIVATHSRSFYSACQKMRDLMKISPKVSKENRIIEDSTPQLADMDSHRSFFQPSPQIGNSVTLTNEVV